MSEKPLFQWQSALFEKDNNVALINQIFVLYSRYFNKTTPSAFAKLP